ncbi:uncharacterized protein LOC106177795 isoform X1 [Lingula anatina]|uniref:Uncharacterized protein LOC106177795 isoform X1 n=1 Tax=Lingula anatina TaxID=7574 RepID=A0A1S3K0H5_LINAN|nr:uncharacterized protein LOC106177795 isoform X1 [Lingula anatina]|eukprot:XP_013416145.1 uncharacterized protein LOC106177795 isoform X1 [Lingula anatina]
MLLWLTQEVNHSIPGSNENLWDGLVTFMGSIIFAKKLPKCSLLKTELWFIILTENSMGDIILIARVQYVLNLDGISQSSFLQFNLQRFQLEIFEGSSPLLSRRLLYADQTNDSLPSDVPINSSSVTIRLYSRAWNWDTHGLQSLVFGIKISSDTSTGSIGNFVIEENTFFNNGLGGVNITTFGQSNWDININKNIFHRNGLSTSNRAEHSKAAFRLNIANTNATLANNYMEGIHGGSHATTHSVFQNNKLNIWSNQILYTTQIENILVAEIEDGPHTQQCSIDGNVIQHGQGDRYSDVLHLEGVSGTVTNNYIYNNTGLHVMWWTTPANRNTSEVTTDNIIHVLLACRG